MNSTELSCQLYSWFCDLYQCSNSALYICLFQCPQIVRSISVLLAPITEHCPYRYFIHKENKGWPSYMLIGRSQHNRFPTCPAGRQNPVRARWRRSSGTTPAAGSGGTDQQVPHWLQGLVCVYLKWLPMCIYQNPKLSPKFQ